MTSVTFKTLFIVAILFVGAVYSLLPHYIRYDTLKEQGEQYVPLTKKSYFDVMNVHGVRYREIVDGNIFAGDVDTYEYKDGPSIWPLLSASLLAPFFIPFDTIFPGLIITDLLFPVFIFCAFFLIIHALTEHRLYSLFSAFVLVLFPQLPLLIPPSSSGEFINLFSQFIPPPLGSSTIDLTYLSRESFIPGAPFFILFFYFVYRATNQESRRNFYLILGGIFYGLLFYLYFYYWVFATIFLGLFFVVLLIIKSNSQARRIFFVALIGVMVSIPFWVNQYTLSQLPHSSDLIERIGIEVGHGVKWFLWKTYVLFFAMAIASVWFSKKLGTPFAGLILSTIALSSIVALNANVVTGFVPQSDHWSGRVFLITNGIIFSVLLYYIYVVSQKYESVKKLRKIVIMVIGITLLSLASNVLYNDVLLNKENAEAYTVSAQLMTAYEWLNLNTPKDSVVITPSIEANVDLPVYTHNRIYLVRAFTSLASEEEILERMYHTYKHFGISAEYVYSMADYFDWVNYFLGAKHDDQSIDRYLNPGKYEHDAQLPKEVKTKIINDYVFFKNQTDFPHRADYIFWGPQERAMGADEKALERYNKIYDKDGVTIYKL